MNRKNAYILFGLNENNYSYRGVAYLLFGYLGALLFAALLTPLVHQWITAGAAAYPDSLFTYLESKHIRKIFDRLFYIPLLFLIPFGVYLLKLGSFKKLGFTLSRGGTRQLLTGASIGVAIMAAIVLLHILFADVALKSEVNWAKLFFKAALTGVLVSTIEEIVFRGMILRLFYTAFKPPLAILLSSLFFAWVHFRMPGGVWDASGQTVSWSSGFFIAQHTIIGFWHDSDLLSLISLTTFGALLSVLYLKKDSLMPSIGLHAGVVFAMVLYKKSSNLTSANPLWLGSKELTDGILPLAILILCLALSLICLRNPSKN